MARAPRKSGSKVNYEAQPMIPPERRLEAAKWQKSYGMFITGQSFIDEVKIVEREMNRRWGASRLRLIVGPELRDKFDRQRYMFNQAVWYGELEDVRQQSQRMINAWKALDKQATATGQTIMLPEVWDITSPKGHVYAFVRDRDDAKVYERDRPSVRVFTLEEICLILDAQEAVGEAKEAFPDAEVVAWSKGSVGDVLDDIEDTSRRLDDLLDDEIPF